MEADPVALALDDTNPSSNDNALGRILDALALTLQYSMFAVMKVQGGDEPVLLSSTATRDTPAGPVDRSEARSLLDLAGRSSDETIATTLPSGERCLLAPVRSGGGRGGDTLGLLGVRGWDAAAGAPGPDVLTRTARIIGLRSAVGQQAPAVMDPDDTSDRASVLPDLLEELSKPTLDTASLLRTIVERAATIVGDACLLSLVDHDRQHLVRAAFSHPDPSVSAWIAANMLSNPVPLDQSLAGEVLRNGETLFIPEADPTDIMQRASPELTSYVALHGIASLIVVPLAFEGDIVGVLRLHRDSPGRPYTRLDRAFAEDLAAHAALAISNARLIEALRRSEAELRSVLDQAADAVVLIDEHGVIRSFNAAAERLLGYPSADMIGRSATELFASIDDGHPLSDLVGEEHEIVGRRPDGTTYAAALKVSAVDVGEGRVVYTTIARDVTNRKRTERATQHAALHDPLTGLPNRRLLEDRLGQAVARSIRTNEPLAVLFLDLDGFKSVNDNYGHEAGDGILRLASERLRDEVRGEDTLARLGGDEFVGVLEHVDPEGRDAVAIARRLLAAFESPFSHAGRLVPIGASIGIATGCGPGLTADDLISQADEAMYEAKRLGRNQCALRRV